MVTIDEMLRAPAEKALSPVVRWLKIREAAGDELKVEIYRPESGLGSSTTYLVVNRKEGGIEQTPQQHEWDDDLNAALVNLLKIKAVDLENEGERFALALRAALQKVARQYGDGYLNAVLVEMISESDLGKSKEVSDILKFVRVSSPSHGRSYSECRDQIASAIGGRAAELREKLEYEEDDLRKIMTKAIARYLDERFSVTRLRQLGML